MNRELPMMQREGGGEFTYQPAWVPMLFLLGFCLLVASGCDTVPFYEKRRLADPIMKLDFDPTEIHFLEKVRYSREGSAGGVGTAAGGGCGCY